MTLTQTALLTKQTITITLITLIIGIVSFIGYRIWYTYYLSTLPPVEEKPDTKFGILPLPDFPKTSVSSSNFSYSLDTKTGGLPRVGIDPGFEKLIKVYFVIKPYATFLSADKSQSLAGKFNINTAPQILSETSYRFKDGEKSLTVDLDSGNFTYVNEATSAAIENLDDDNRLISDFKNTLNNLGSLPSELKEGRAEVILLKIEGNTFSPTQLRTEASAAQISLWPKSLDGKLIFTTDFNKAYLNATVVNSASSLENYLSLEFKHYQIDTQTFATYPIKSTDEAFEDLRKGKGTVLVEPKNPQVSITSASLGYFLPETYSPYVQPIFVFEGPGFVSYVPAVSSQFQKE